MTRITRFGTLAIVVCALLAAAFVGLTTVALLRVNDAVDAVQASRIDQCQATNDRHDAAITELDRQISELPPVQQARAKARRDQTLAFIDALVPKRDCVAALAPK